MARLITIATVVGTVLSFSPNAMADFKTGNDLFTECHSADTDYRMECLGYIMGIADADNSPLIYTTKIQGTLAQKVRICLRSEVTGGQVRDVVLKYLTDHPGMRDLEATTLVQVALAESFPCYK